MRTAPVALALLVPPCASFAKSSANEIARGRYIAERVGMCGDCHTPHDATGNPVMSPLLRGAPLGFRPMVAMPFAEVAPPIAGGPAGWSDFALVRFLETGERPSRRPPLPPMPSYRMSPADAAAVAAYLRSLK